MSLNSAFIQSIKNITNALLLQELKLEKNVFTSNPMGKDFLAYIFKTIKNVLLLLFFNNKYSYFRMCMVKKIPSDLIMKFS